MNQSLGSVKNKHLIKVLQKYDEDADITFEFLIASFFPEAFNNMRSLIKDAYTEGYIQAREEVRNE